MTAKKNPKQGTVDAWKDSIGQEFRPGDLVSVSVINGRSPQMVIARVDRINTTNPKGEPHTRSVKTGTKTYSPYERHEYIGPDYEPEYVGNHWSGRRDMDAIRRNQEKRNNRDNYKTTVVERWLPDYHDVQDVTVTATPLLDGRGFWRSNGQQKFVYDEETGKYGYVTDETKPKTRPVTYTIIENIVKLPAHVTEEFVAKLAEEREFEK